MHVTVRDNNVDQALKALKKKMQREGVFREMKLRRAYEKPSEKRAREKAEAVRRAMQDVGRALLITSVVLVAGFLVLTASALDSQATYGILLATTIVTALSADFLLMPALLLTFQPFGPEKSQHELRENE